MCSHVYDDFPPSLYVAYGWDTICNDFNSFKWPSIWQWTVAAVYFQFETLLTQVAQQVCHVTWQNWHRNVETRKATHLSLRQVMAHFWGWIGRVVHCFPFHTALRKEIMTSNFDSCIGHGPSFWWMPKPFSLATFWKCQLNTLNMFDCVVNRKLLYFYMLGMKACMHVAHVFQKLNI